MTTQPPLLPAGIKGCGDAPGCQRAESEFLAAMSHAFRTPIHGVLGLAELLASATLPPAESEYVRMIDQCARSLLALVDDALEAAQRETGQLRVHEAEIELPPLLRELAAGFALRAEEKGLAFELGTDAAVPTGILGDARRLRQVLQTLLDNALKFTAAGGIALDVHVRRLPAGERLAFAVHDTGIGIAPADQARLFGRFAGLAAAGTRQHGGHGLGLATARDLARRMGGDIELASRPGEGATFTLVLPLRQPATGPRAPAGASRANAAILLVEDNTVNQVVARGLLANLGHHRVTLAGDGLQALAACARERFDLVLMDCQMPQMDGLRATALLRQRGVTTPILALTASPVIGDRDRCLAAGMNDYLTKPIDPALLARKLAQWLQSPPAAVMPSPRAMLESSARDFDAGALQERFCGDAEVFAQCRRIFVRQTPERLAEAAGSIASGDAARARFVAHTLRGSAATVGALRLAHCCRRIEQSLEADAVNFEAASAQLAVAQAAFAGFVEASAGHSGQEDSLAPLGRGWG